VRIAALGRGHLGGGLAKRWERAGHEVKRIGREGGDVSDAAVVLLAVPYTAIADAIAGASGIAGKPLIDATNLFGGERPAGFDSLAAYAKSLTGGPVAKAFNAQFATLFERIPEARLPPSNLYASDPGAREITERLSRDAGFEPVRVGELAAARILEDFPPVLLGIVQSGMEPCFYRFAPPDRL
jgi:8-hydroxy-5-deazaflavin:NADPH oxidoreductase